jgi:hypothetical protein
MWTDSTVLACRRLSSFPDARCCGDVYRSAEKRPGRGGQHGRSAIAYEWRMETLRLVSSTAVLPGTLPVRTLCNSSTRRVFSLTTLHMPAVVTHATPSFWTV